METGPLLQAQRKLVFSSSGYPNGTLFLKTLKGKSFIEQVALSEDDQYLISASDEVFLWDLEVGQCLRQFKGHLSLAARIAWSTNQLRLLSGDGTGAIFLWDVATDQRLSVFVGHTDRITSLVWSNDNRRALSASFDKTIRLWDVETGLCLRVLEGHTKAVRTIAWHPDQHLAVCSQDTRVRLWDTQSGRCLAVLEGHHSNIRSVVWSTDGYHAFSGDEFGHIYVWDLGTIRPKGTGTSLINCTGPGSIHECQSPTSR